MEQKTWEDAAQLAIAMEEHILCGHRRVVLSPSTALWIARQIRNAVQRRENQKLQPRKIDKFAIDLYDTGSCIMNVDDEGDILEILAWARNSLVARAAFDELCRREPNYSLHQRRGGWIEGERLVCR